ncbi:MAG: hypothetical protein DI538_16050 [Azospira oryzae]|jgi:signal transduction histidine kinase|nr:MAG: hypothetical protein DI538_16050 [Azospira oryzae]
MNGFFNKGMLSICILCGMTGIKSTAQDSRKKDTDSLRKNLSLIKEDTNKVLAYVKLGSLYYQTNPDSFFRYTHQGLALARALKWKRGIANCTNNIGLLLSDTGNYSLAITYLKESLRINREIQSRLNIINNLTNLGRIYYRQGDFITSSDYYFDALQAAEKINNHEKIAMIGTNLTATFCSQKDWVKGEKYALLTLHHSELANAPMHTFKALIALGEISLQRSDTLKARTYLKKALHTSVKNELRLMSAEALNNLAGLNANYDSALMTAMEARKIFDEMNPNSISAVMNLGVVASLYLNLYQSRPQPGYIKNAEYYLNEQIKKCTDFKYAEGLASGLKQMALLQEMKGNFALAYQYNKQFHHINDSLFSQENKNKIAAIEGQREVALRDRKIALNKQELLDKENQLIAVIAGSVVLSMAGMFFYYQNKIRQRTNEKLLRLNTKLDQANQAKAKIFAIISHDLRGPIARLIHFLHLQKEAPDLLSKEQVIDHQQRITASAENLLHTMEEILLWSKGQLENFKPSLQPIVVQDLFHRLGKSYEHVDRVSISFENAGNCILISDENFVYPILQNLTANAIKALAQTQEPKIAWRATQNDRGIILSITDNGPGMKDSWEEPLENINKVTSEANGFGFYIIRDLANIIQCTISADSHPGQGTTFRLFFQAKKDGDHYQSVLKEPSVSGAE